MIGLILSAVGAAASMAGQIMPNKSVVENTKVYTPNSSSFQGAGLFNNSVADVGMIETEQNVEKENPSKTVMQGIGAAATIAGSFIGNKSAGSSATPPAG